MAHYRQSYLATRGSFESLMSEWPTTPLRYFVELVDEAHCADMPNEDILLAIRSAADDILETRDDWNDE